MQSLTQRSLIAAVATLAAVGCSSTPPPRACGDTGWNEPDVAAIDSYAITWLGTATVLLEVGPFRLITDPAFDPAGTEYDFGPWYTPESWCYSKKTVETASAIDALGPLDAALVSHEHHGDNLDHRGRELLTFGTVREVVTTLPGSVRLGEDVERDGSDRYELNGAGLGIAGKTTGLQPWECHLLESGNQAIQVTATPARHGPEGSPQVDEVVGFVLQWKGQEHGAVYVSGDTVLYPELEKLPATLRKQGIGSIDLALIHVGGVRLPEMWFYGEDLFTFDAAQACRFARLLNPRRIVFIHHTDWTHFRDPIENLKALVAADAELAGKVLWVERGVRVQVD